MEVAPMDGNKRVASHHVSNEVEADIEIVTQRIEAAGLDITAEYQAWLTLGFALADGLGEAGRAYYHRLSKFYPGYKPEDTNRQYDSCLRGRRTGGVSIKSFFELAKRNGIDIRTRRNATDAAPREILPTFPPEVYRHLPKFLQDVTESGTSYAERDSLLLGALTVISGALPRIYGVYDRMRVFANLFFYLTARASSGKGRVSLCKRLVVPIDKMRQEEFAKRWEAYEEAMRVYEANKKKPDVKKPVPPPFLKLLIPANISATAFYRMLADNDGIGILSESEGDTLANSFASDYGDFSDGLRKAFHHEAISFHRRKDNEHCELEDPKLSASLTGTPKQVLTLIPEVENGLFSRFIFYYLEEPELVWKDVWSECEEEPLEEVFDRLGARYKEFYMAMEGLECPLVFSFSAGQKKRFNAFFESEQRRLHGTWGDDLLASVRRMGLVAFRIAMIFTAVRRMDTGDFYSPLVCSDEDFELVILMVGVLIRHTEKVYATLYEKKPLNAPKEASANLKERFFEELPEEFSKGDYIDLAKRIGLNVRTAEGYINRAAEKKNGIVRVAQGLYKKIK